MPIRKAYPVKFTIKGVTDAFDATDAFSGACKTLSNLILSQTNPELVQPRPGVGLPITTFTGFTSPTYVSLCIVVGNMAYGMVSTAATPGYDEPFAYDIVNNAFIAITGVTAINVPASPVTSGAWVPPTATIVGPHVVITHPGFTGTGTQFFGMIDITNPAAPVWSAQNTATHGLPSAPTAVANFNNRAYFACGNVVYFSDSLVPGTITNASQSVTVGDSTPVVALVGLPLVTTSGGVVQSLTIFKGYQVWQVTGDSTASNLSLNFLSLNTGTSSPRSVVQTPNGVFFAAVDGPYYVDTVGSVKPISAPNRDVPDVQYPYVNCTQPSRTTSSFAAGIYRTCIETIDLFGNGLTGDYWLSTHRQRWTGPHTFPYDCAAAYGDSFLLSHSTMGAALFKSDSIPTIASVYQDATFAASTYTLAGFTCTVESSTLPKVGDMSQKQVIEATIELAGTASGASSIFSITALDEQQNLLNSVNVQTIVGSGYLWGGASTPYVWNGGVWGAGQLSAPSVYTVPWSAPLVFQKMCLRVSVLASDNIAIGTFYARYQSAGYTNQQV